METTLSQPPIATAPQQISTPRRVGLVMTYNQRESCIEAINSLLTQTLALDIIIVSDDCSIDGTYEVITDYFSKNGKPSNVELYQSEKNLGFIPHFNALLKNNCRDDDLIFYNAGDDISEVNRVEEFYGEYIAQGKPRHFLGHSYVTSFGSGTEEILVPPIESIKENRELCLIASAYHIGASQVFTGALFSDFGPILFDDCYEDLTLGYRALLKNAYHFIPKALLRYRIGGLSSWQKNPLEKKRGRLKSTLTQRAVDSMRSGDFETLITIQDCYSQYGFAHAPHNNKVSIDIIADNWVDPRMETYSIASHFGVISNVCKSNQIKTVNFLKQIRSYQPTMMGSQKHILWIIVPRIDQELLLALVRSLTELPLKNIVFDFGIPPSAGTLGTPIALIQFAKYIVGSIPNAAIHTSCHGFYNEALKEKVSNVTYLPPLQAVDGPDPTPKPTKKRRGLLALNDGSELSMHALSKVINAHSNFDSRLGAIDFVRTRGETEWSTIGRWACTPEDKGTRSLSDLSNYDYLIILNHCSPLNTDAILYWWGLGAQFLLPTFMNSGATSNKALTHGKNCLFVDHSTTAWNNAFHLISEEFPALQLVASKARRDVYFDFSVQKKVALITRLIGYCHTTSPIFDKFLPL